MKIQLDARHSLNRSTLYCSVSATDLKKGNSVAVNMDVVLTHQRDINRILFEFDANALEWVAQEIRVEPESVLTFAIDENTLQTLNTVQDMVGTSYYLIPIYRISGFVQCYSEEPKNRQRSLFDDDL